MIKMDFMFKLNEEMTLDKKYSIRNKNKMMGVVRYGSIFIKGLLQF